MNSDQATVGAFVITALVATAAAARWLFPRLARFFRSLDRMFETINGRPAEVDKAGREVSPSVPSLSVQMADLKAEIGERKLMERRLTDVEGRVTALESGSQVERIVTKVESAQAWRAVEAIANQPGTAIQEGDK
jgi:DNA-binding transcriptional LysR family regulator